MTILSRAVRSAKAALLPESRRFEGSVIPAPHLRFGGKYFQRDEDFVRSGEREATRLIERLGIHAGSRVLEIGCGPGRLAIGLLRRLGGLATYRAVDVDRAAVRWCRRNIEAHHPAFRFVHLDVANARYNPHGEVSAASLRLPFEDRGFDVAYLYSVFSHMLEPDVVSYLAEMARVLEPGGRVFLTAFVEDDVPPVSENPPDYRRTWRGALHCVRYERQHLVGLMRRAGFTVETIEHGTETDGQSGLVAQLVVGAPAPSDGHEGPVRR